MWREEKAVENELQLILNPNAKGNI